MKDIDRRKASLSKDCMVAFCSRTGLVVNARTYWNVSKQMSRRNLSLGLLWLQPGGKHDAVATPNRQLGGNQFVFHYVHCNLLAGATADDVESKPKARQEASNAFANTLADFEAGWRVGEITVRLAPSL